MTRQAKGACQHGWALPDDGWVLREQHGPMRRIMRCRLCGKSRVELYEYGRWKAIRQLEFYTLEPEPPKWQQDFESPILKEDWDWSK